jgi:hypothetical protein
MSSARSLLRTTGFCHLLFRRLRRPGLILVCCLDSISVQRLNTTVTVNICVTLYVVGFIDCGVQVNGALMPRSSSLCGIVRTNLCLSGFYLLVC